MPAYNCERFIAEAIRSVLNQTFTDFELIVLDDGSTDGTLAAAERFSDSRLVVLPNKHDFIATLNRGLDCASGRYLARMDADDLIPVDRLAVQHAILEGHAQIDVCSGWMQAFGESVNRQLLRIAPGYVRHPLLLMLQTNFVYNATTMCRTAFVRDRVLRYREYPYAEDFLFWCEAARAGATFFVESRVLYYYRMWENQVGRRYRREQEASSWKIRRQVVQWLVDDLSDGDVSAVYDLACGLNEQGMLSDVAFTTLFYELFSQIER